MREKKLGRPKKKNTGRIEFRIPAEHKAMLDRVISASVIRSYSEWARLAIERAHKELLLSRTDSLPFASEGRLAEELDRRGIDLSEIDKLLMNKTELKRLGLYEQRAVLKSLSDQYMEGLEGSQIRQMLVDRGITLTELKKIVRSKKEMRRLGFADLEDALKRLLADGEAEANQQQ